LPGVTIHTLIIISINVLDINAIQRLEEIPYILFRCLKNLISKSALNRRSLSILTPVGQQVESPVKFPLDKATTLNQIKALKSILADYLGNKRRIFLVIDHEGINKPEMAFLHEPPAFGD
jgi:hypothetical protein